MSQTPVTGVVCLCSRGLIHSRTAEGLELNLLELRAEGETWLVEYTHDLPIPVAQNDITTRALRSDPEFVLYVEEDNVLPVGMINEMMQTAEAERADVVVAEYPLTRGIRSVYKTVKGRVIFGGMGCLLVRADVFPKLPQPWFETREHYWNETTGEFERRPGRAGYGGQDVDFFYKLFGAGIPVVEAARPIRHLRLKNDIIQRSNNGCFEVIDL